MTLTIRDKRRINDKTSSFIFGMLFIILFLFAILLVTTPEMNMRISEISYNIKAKAISEISDDSFANSVAETCNVYDQMNSKIACVVDIFEEIYEYNITSSTYMPSKLKTTPADCTSAALFYKLIFDKMNINNRIVLMPEHVYNIAYNDDSHCMVDQYLYYCTDYKPIEQDNYDLFFKIAECVINNRDENTTIYNFDNEIIYE